MKSKFKNLIGICSSIILAFSVQLPVHAGGCISGCISATGKLIEEKINSHRNKVKDDYGLLGSLRYSFKADTGELTISGTGSIHWNYGQHVLPDNFSPHTRENVTSIIITDGITEIEMHALTPFKNLEEIFIPRSVNKIGEDAFPIDQSPCITVDGNSQYYKSVNGILFSKNGTELVFYPKNDASYTIPHGVIKIGNGAFSNHNNLIFVTIPNSVTEIGDSAFGGCKGLTSVIIPNSVKKIDYRAFGGCINLNSVTLGNNVTSIGKYAFHLANFTSIIIPDSVKEIGAAAFKNCDKLREVNIPNGVTILPGRLLYDKRKGDDLYGLEWKEHGIFYGCTNLKKVTIPNSVTRIGNGTFYGCENLTEVTIPSSVKEIGWYAFNGCKSLPEVTIPKSVTEVGYKAFAGCTDLAWVNFENPLTRTDNTAFLDCPGLF